MGFHAKKSDNIYYLDAKMFGKQVNVNDISLFGVYTKFLLEIIKRATKGTRIPDWIDAWEFKNHRQYWTRRGGAQYMSEQESQDERTLRSEFIADQIASLAPESVLEIGCGYGKQLKNIRKRIPATLHGIDFSVTQLQKAKENLHGCENVFLHVGDGSKLPFKDKSFDLVLTSAVILHNKPNVAQAIRDEAIRVSRKWIVHNEDINVNYSRFGYDNAQIYKDMGYEVVLCRQIPVAPDPENTQFCVVRVDSAQKKV